MGCRLGFRVGGATLNPNPTLHNPDAFAVNTEAAAGKRRKRTPLLQARPSSDCTPGSAMYR